MAFQFFVDLALIIGWPRREADKGLFIEKLPELFCKVRCERCKKLGKVLERDCTDAFFFDEIVCELHNAYERVVEFERFNAGCNVSDGSVKLALLILWKLACEFLSRVEVDDSGEEAVSARNAFVIPFEVFVGGGDEEEEEPRSVDPECFFNFFLGDNVSFALAHDRSFLVYHALVKEADAWFVNGEEANISEKFGKEPKVNEVHCRVFLATDVRVNGHPVRSFFWAERLCVVMLVAVAQEVPATIKEGVHSVRFSFCWLAT